MKKGISAGLAGLCALGIAGDFIIRPTLSSDDGSDIIGILAATVLSFFMFLFIYPLLTRLFRKDCGAVSGLKCFAYSAVYLTMSALLIGIAVFSLVDLTLFTADVVLPDVSKAFIFAAFLLTTLIIASKKISSLSKTAVILFAVTLLSVTAIFLFSIPHMRLRYVYPMTDFSSKNVLNTAVSVFMRSFLPGFVLVLGISGEVSGTKSTVAGNIAGSLLLFLCGLNTLLIFGGGFASTLSYPYTAAVRTVGAGDIFSGMDGILYIAVFFCNIIKISLAFYGVKCLSLKIYNIKKFS